MKGKTVQIWKLYQVEGADLKRVNRFCPKCGKGTFMAKHKDRWYCGRCGYTEFISDRKR